MDNSTLQLGPIMARPIAAQQAGPSRSERAQPIIAFRPEAEPGKGFCPIGTGGLPAKSGLPMVGGGVAGEQGGRVADRLGGRREGRNSPEGFSGVEVIGGGGRTSASRSRGHQRGLSSWGGSTRRRDAWGGVDTVGEGLERAVCSGSATASTAVFAAAQER
jgi:hypothetical protein